MAKIDNETVLAVKILILAVILSVAILAVMYFILSNSGLYQAVSGVFSTFNQTKYFHNLTVCLNANYVNIRNPYQYYLFNSTFVQALNQSCKISASQGSDLCQTLWSCEKLVK